MGRVIVRSVVMHYTRMVGLYPLLTGIPFTQCIETFAWIHLSMTTTFLAQVANRSWPRLGRNLAEVMQAAQITRMVLILDYGKLRKEAY